MSETKTILEEIAAKRQRQIVFHGHMPAGDDRLYAQELIAKAEERLIRVRECETSAEMRDELLEAAATIVAEVERMDRAKLPLHLFRVDDYERFWIVARDEADAAEVFSWEIDALGEAEKLALRDKTTRISDDDPVTIYDGAPKTTKTAADWVLVGRGVIAQAGGE